MDNKPNKEELVKRILESYVDFEVESEELLHLLLQETVATDTHKIHKNTMSFGDKMSDRFAQLAGSWNFIIGFTFILIIWIAGNAYLMKKPFDPFPFILLNLVLSCIAAIQAPIIMMSQNRQEEKDRLRSQNDYKVNLKSEFIIEDLHEKIDMLIDNQNNIIERLEAIEAFNNKTSKKN